MTHLTSTGAKEEEFELRPIWQAQKKALVPDNHHMLKLLPVQTMEFPESNEHIINGGTCSQRFVLHPSSLKRLAWDLMGFALLSYDIIIIPFQSAFNPPPFTFGLIMVNFSMAFWSLDILLSTITGFQKGGSTVMVPQYILGRYARTWLLMDLCVVGLDWGVMIWSEVNDGAATNDAVRQGRSLRMLRYLRALRLLRLLKLRKIFNEIQDHINTEMLATSFTILRIIVGLVVANHIIACGWFALGESALGEGSNADTNEHSWVAANRMMERDIGYRYATSMHWSLTQFTPASMEIRPYNFGERLFSIVVLILAMLTFSSFVSTLTASITRLSDIRKNELRQFWLLRRYLRDLKISRQLALRVQRYVEYSFARQQRTVQEGDVKLLLLLSEPLREELKVEIFGPCLCIHPLFEEIQDSVRGFSKAMQALNIAHGDIVFSYGEEAMEMYFVTSGQLQYERGKEVVHMSSEREEEDDNKDPLDIEMEKQVTPELLDSQHSEVEHLARGEWVCEPPLWTYWHHRGFLTAQSDCTLVAVDSSQFSSVIRGSGPNWGFVRRYAANYVELLNNLAPAACSDVINREFPLKAADGLMSSTASKRTTHLGLGSNRVSNRRRLGGTHGLHQSTPWERVQLAWLRFKNWRWMSCFFATSFVGRDSGENPDT